MNPAYIPLVLRLIDVAADFLGGVFRKIEMGLADLPEEDRRKILERAATVRERARAKLEGL